MKRRAFCGMTLAAGAVASLPTGRRVYAQGKSAQPEPADLRAIKLSGAETSIERAAVQDFRASLRGPDRNYGPNFARLAAVKKQFDPLNLFRLNANIKPA